MSTLMILGANGMLGYSLLRHLSANPSRVVHGSLRSLAPSLPDAGSAMLHGGIEATDFSSVEDLLEQVKPDVLINCIGLIKQRDNAVDPALAIALNASFPHQLAAWCDRHGSRLIHFSTDCVFAGDRGGYRESDPADADDLYGRSKRLGEVDYGRHLTLRTSLIGHELASQLSLVDWFLGTRGSVSGYANVIFSGLPTVEIARLLEERILPEKGLTGLYHLSVEPIDKDRLLRIVASQYGHCVDIRRCEEPRLDRSLNSDRLRAALEYEPPTWEALVARMHEDYLKHYAALRSAEERHP